VTLFAITQSSAKAQGISKLDYNIALLTDGYKLTHWPQYPLHTEYVNSYLESRGGKWKYNLFFGLQYFLKKYLAGQVIDDDKVAEAATFSKEYFGNEYFNIKGWRHIVEKYKGRLPVIIKAVPEGTVLPTKNVLITVENTDPECYWLTNYLETLLVQIWYPISVATQSWHMRQVLLKYLESNGTPEEIDYKLHDFGFRGVSSPETAAIGGAAHLVNFKGTDTINGIIMAQQYYNSGVCGNTIPASEHSTITSWGKENEGKAFANMLKKYPRGTIACVSDSFNIYDACEKLWGEDLHMKIVARDGCLVIRPDSGNAHIVLPRILEILGNKFGVQKNAKGFKVLNPKVRVIQGDGIDAQSMESIIEELHMACWSTDNIAFGSGGGLLQKLNRDDAKFAFKCSSIIIDGKEREVFKSPITDPGKKSKAGRLALVKVQGPTENSYSYRTIKQKEKDSIVHDNLVTVFHNGEVTKEYDFDDIRRRALETGRAVKEFEGL
jgi:nicotinamide phosphoribosyltransferase